MGLAARGCCSCKGSLRHSRSRDGRGRYSAGAVCDGARRLPLQRILLAARPQPRLQRLVRLSGGSKKMHTARGRAGKDLHVHLFHVARGHTPSACYMSPMYACTLLTAARAYEFAVLHSVAA